MPVQDSCRVYLRAVHILKVPSANHGLAPEWIVIVLGDSVPDTQLPLR